MSIEQYSHFLWEKYRSSGWLQCVGIGGDKIILYVYTRPWNLWKPKLNLNEGPFPIIIRKIGKGFAPLGPT